MTFWLLVQRWHIRNDINLMVNFKPGEYMRKMIYSVSDTGGSDYGLFFLRENYSIYFS